MYGEMQGWEGSTMGVNAYKKLPANARSDLKRIDDSTETTADVISTCPHRAKTMVVRRPLDW